MLQPFSTRVVRRASVLLFVGLAACSDSTAVDRPDRFLDGTPPNREVVVVLGANRAVTLLHAADPTLRREIALGASDAITVTGAVIRGNRAAIPLGNAASVAIVNLDEERIERAFTFASGNATGAAWIDDNTIVAANLLGDYVGRISLSSSANTITNTVAVTPAPTAVLARNGRAFVISGNLDDSFMPLGSGVITAVDPATMTVVGTATVGLNPQSAAFGADGKLYVVNTGDYMAIDGTISIIDPQTMTVEATVPGFGNGPGVITIDAAGFAYVSSYSYGTAVWNTQTRQFVRAPAQALCAPTPTGCRGAAHAAAGSDGAVYQSFLGSQTLAPYVFVYRGAGLTLSDSISATGGPLWLDVRRFE